MNTLCCAGSAIRNTTMHLSFQVPLIASTTKGTDFESLKCMITNCGKQIVNCVNDATCKAGLDCLNGCEFNDQVRNHCLSCQDSAM